MQTEPTSVALNPLRTALVVFVPHATMNISFLGSSVWAIKLVSSNVSKDRCFQQYLVFEILLSYTQKPSNILGKNPLLISLFFYDYLQIKFVSFLKVWPATIPFRRKTIKWATTLDIKKKGKGKKERSSVRKNKKLLHYILLVGKYVFVDAKLSFCHSLANWPKTSPKKRNWWTMRFFSLLSGIRQWVNPFVPE